MRESTKIGKRLMALFLVLLLSIESFAAIVGDNDGSAFITNKTTAKMIQHKKALKV